MSQMLFIVTGASGGFGSAILRQINTLYGSEASIIACTRDQGSVAEQTKDFLSRVILTSVDFSQRDAIKDRCEAMIKLFNDDLSTFSEVVLINNHASVNDVKRLVGEFDDYREVDDYMFLNFTSFQILTAVFLNRFRKREGLEVSLINISSLAALQPLPSLSIYCAGKGARMMLYKTLAGEYPDVNVLNYSPGPMLTAMTSNFSSDSACSVVKDFFVDLQAKNSYVDPDESANKMLRLLKERKYKSGDQLDFYDR